MLFENPTVFSVITERYVDHHLLDHNVAASGVAGSLRLMSVFK